jgi:large subunit ribosomal protein L22
MKKADVYAKHKLARISPKKVAIVMDMVRGEALEKAKVILAFDKTKASEMILKVLKSAEANAVNNNNFKPEDLYLSDVYVNPGRIYKFGKMGSKGRFNPILKRTSHIVVGLSPRQESKKLKGKK